VASTDQQLLDLKQQVAALQEKVNWMYDQLTSGEHHIAKMPSAPGSEISPEVMDLARQGKKLEALTLYRSQSGASLSEAKSAIDGL